MAGKPGATEDDLTGGGSANAASGSQGNIGLNGSLPHFLTYSTRPEAVATRHPITVV